MCDQRLVVPMSPGSDSVNVAVASGIFLYAFSAFRGLAGFSGLGSIGV